MNNLDFCKFRGTVRLFRGKRLRTEDLTWGHLSRVTWSMTPKSMRRTPRRKIALKRRSQRTSSLVVTANESLPEFD